MSLAALVENPTAVSRDLGPVARRTDVQSSLAPFFSVNAPTVYPMVVVKALEFLVQEYNTCFPSLLPAHTQSTSAYQFCQPAAMAVQVDMVGLTDDVLAYLETLPLAKVVEYLRRRIFEIDSSIAMYQLLERLFPAPDGGPSAFRRAWRAALDDVRRRTGLPVAVLAVTQSKYDAMLVTEFGLQPGDPVTPELVQEYTGFDAFFGPDEFLSYLAQNNGECGYALFVRSSLPTEALRNPGTEVEHPLLSDPQLLELIRDHAITINVDDPDAPWAEQINDTKGYMPLMGLGFIVESLADLETLDFEEFLTQHGVTWDDLRSGRVTLRAKPAVSSYGAYGHIRRGWNKKFRQELAREILARGPYVIQLELDVPVVTNDHNGEAAGFIDRNFVFIVDGQVYFGCGFRNHMPVDTTEYAKGRVHGNGEAFWSEIVRPAA